MAVIKIHVKGNQAETQLRRLRSEFGKTDVSIERTRKQTSLFNRDLRGMALSIGGYFSTKKLVDYADSFTNINNKIALVTNSERELTGTRKQLLEISNRARVGLDGTADLYRRMFQATEKLNYSQGTLLAITESISKSLTISGGSAASADAALLQLSQGFASGTLRGQELNSVMEQAPRLARAISDGMGIAYGDLRKVAEQGGLTTVKVMEALRSQASVIDSEFLKTNASISSSFTVLKNNVTEVIGVIDKSFGGSSGLSSGIISFGEALKSNIGLISEVAKQAVVLGATFATLKAYNMAKVFFNQGTSVVYLADMFKLAKTSSIGMSIALSKVGNSLKLIALSNAPMLAILAIYETWNYLSGQVAEKEAELTRILGLKNKALTDLSNAQALNTLNTLQSELSAHRLATHELTLQLKIAKGRNRVTNDETIALRAELDTHIQNTNEIKKQIGVVNSVINGTYKVTDNLNESTTAAGNLAKNLSVSKNQAISLAQALSGTSLAIEKQAVRAKLLAGDISKKKSIQIGFNLDKKSFADTKLALDSKMKNLIDGGVRENQDAINKLSGEYAKLELARLTASNDLVENMQRIDKLDLARSTKSSTSSLKAQTKEAKELLNIRRDYYRLIGSEEEVFSLDASKKLTEMMKTGVFSQAEMSKAYDAMWKDFKSTGEDSIDSIGDSFASIFQQGFESILKGDFAGGLADMLGDAMSSATSNLSSALSGGLGNIFSGAGSFMDAFKSINPMDLVGSAVSLVGGLLSTTLSEAEIKVAAGRTEFDSEGTSEIVSTLKQYQAPQLTATKSMLTHLESMDTNLVQALNTSSSLDLGGSNYTPKTSSIAGGVIFASSTELLGAGIKFYDQAVSGFIEGVEADGYESVKKTSSLLGIFTSERVSESLKELPQGTKDQIGEAFNQGLQGALDGLEVLGFNTDAIETQIQNYVVSLGKINFKDLNVEEQADALNRALTQELNGALGEALDFTADPHLYYDLQRFATAGEEIVATTARLATGFETVSTSLGALGQSVATFNQTQGLIDAAGGLSEWKSGQDAFINMLSDGEQNQYYQNLLSTALATYDVALPASKAQFIALKNETEAKIIALRANISIMETELAAKIQSGKISLAAAQGELVGKGKIANAQADVINTQVKNNNYLIDSANNAGSAVVGFGNNVNGMVKGIATGTADAVAAGAKSATDEAGKVDYSNLHSTALDAARSELGKLEGLYGTLMSNMGDFSSYYSGVESASQGASSALSDLEQQLLAIANFKAELTNNKVESTKIILDATTKDTGLTNLTTENVLLELNKNMGALSKVTTKTTNANNNYASSCSAVASSCSTASKSCGSLNTQIDKNSDSNKSLLDDYKAQYSALKAYQKAIREQERGFEDLKLMWLGASDVQNAQVSLNRIIEDTGLTGITYGNFMDKMNEGIANGDGVENWKRLGDAMKSFYQSSDDLATKAQKALLDAGNSTITQIRASYASSINNGDYDSAEKMFSKIIEDANRKEVNAKDRYFSISDANAQIQSVRTQSNKNAKLEKLVDDLTKEVKKLQEPTKESSELLNDIKRNTRRRSVTKIGAAS